MIINWIIAFEMKALRNFFFTFKQNKTDFKIFPATWDLS